MNAAVNQTPPAAAWVLNCHLADQSPNGTVISDDPWKAIVDAVQQADVTDRITVLSDELTKHGFDQTRQAQVMSDISSATDPNIPPPLPRYVLHHAAEALLPQPPVDYVIDGQLARKSVAVFYGPPGSLKTWLLMFLAVCVALGHDWLGFPIVQGPVLVIDEESGLARFNRRLSQLLAGLGITTPPPIYYVCLAQFDPRDPSDLAELETLCDQVKPALVIADALADLMVGGDENAVKDTQPLFRNIRQLADEKDTALALIHHAGKSGQYRGSSAISGAVDLLMSMEVEDPDPNNPDVRVVNLATEKNRDGEPKKFTAEVTFGILKVTVREKTGRGNSVQPRYSKAELYVIDYLTQHGPSLMSDIKSHAGVCTESAARQATYSLAAKKVIRRCDPGGQGSPATFELTPQDPLDAAMNTIIPF